MEGVLCWEGAGEVGRKSPRAIGITPYSWERRGPPRLPFGWVRMGDPKSWHPVPIEEEDRGWGGRACIHPHGKANCGGHGAVGSVLLDPPQWGVPVPWGPHRMGHRGGCCCPLWRWDAMGQPRERAAALPRRKWKNKHCGA